MQAMLAATWPCNQTPGKPTLPHADCPPHRQRQCCQSAVQPVGPAPSSRHGCQHCNLHVGWQQPKGRAQGGSRPLPPSRHNTTQEASLAHPHSGQGPVGPVGPAWHTLTHPRWNSLAHPHSQTAHAKPKPLHPALTPTASQPVGLQRAEETSAKPSPPIQYAIQHPIQGKVGRPHTCVARMQVGGKRCSAMATEQKAPRNRKLDKALRHTFQSPCMQLQELGTSPCKHTAKAFGAAVLAADSACHRLARVRCCCCCTLCGSRSLLTRRPGCATVE